MEPTIQYCLALLEEYAIGHPIDGMPQLRGFDGLCTIQQALFERGMEVQLQVRAVHLGSARSHVTYCAALILDEEVLGLHGARGWEETGRIGARVQATYGAPWDRWGYAGLGEIEEVHLPGQSTSRSPDEQKHFDTFLRQARLTLEHLMLDQATPTASHRAHGPRL